MNGGSATSQPNSGHGPRRPDRLLVAAITVGLTLAACGTGPAVEVERSMASIGELQPDLGGFPGAPPAQVPSDPVVSADRSSVEWGPCEGFGIPDVERLGTERWECGRLDVAMSPDTPDGGLPPVSLALTRHPATGDRFGSILINPGGPGGAGLPLAWNLRGSLPPSVLRGFDIVSWDPRGVGQSTPRVGCPADAAPDDRDFIERCVETTGPLSAFLAAPYSVADMESIRVALGEERLDYLGYSYGSVLGALYAERFPQHVGSFTLDGATDPDVGSPDGPFSGGFATFADDGLPAALERFHELCDATDRCLPGERDTTSVIDDVIRGAAALPTSSFDGAPDVLDSLLVEDHLAASMQSAGEWELLAAGFEEAIAGDGSTLAAHIAISGLLPSTGSNDGGDESGDGSGGDDGSGDGAAPDNFDSANFLIYCADLGPLITEWSFCDDMPVAADPLTPVGPVDLDRPILVIGSEYDPLTPGYHAAEMAERLGDAVWIVWDGVGHTAFPGWSRCIDDTVADHFLGRALPASGLRCEFVDGITDDEQLADELFGFTVDDGRPWVADALFFTDRAGGDDPECLARQIVTEGAVDDVLVSQVILDVRTEEAIAAIEAAASTC